MIILSEFAEKNRYDITRNEVTLKKVQEESAEMRGNDLFIFPAIYTIVSKCAEDDDDPWKCFIIGTQIDAYGAQEIARKHGFKLSDEAIYHNVKAWMHDYKSAYVDRENDVYVFTPCGHNMPRLELCKLKGSPFENEKSYIC